MSNVAKFTNKIHPCRQKRGFFSIHKNGGRYEPLRELSKGVPFDSRLLTAGSHRILCFLCNLIRIPHTFQVVSRENDEKKFHLIHKYGIF
jgi:hypothetical protein